MAGERIEITANNLKAIGDAAGSASGKVSGLTAGMRKLFENIKPENREKFIRAIDDPAIRTAAQTYFAFGQKVPGMPALPSIPRQVMPPPIPGGATTGNVNWTRAMLGMLAAPFSPWIGARSLSASGLFGGGGGGGGGGYGGIFGAGGFMGFMEAFVAIKATVTALRFAFENLKSAVESGARLFQQSAATGVHTGQLARMQMAFQGIGLSPEVANRLMTNMRLGRRSGTAAMPANEALNIALRGGVSAADVQSMMQLRNMSKEFKQYWDDSAVDAKILGDAAKPMQDINMLSERISREWKTIWVNFAMQIEPELRATLSLLGSMLKVVNELAVAFRYAGEAAAKAWIQMGGPFGMGISQLLSALLKGLPKAPTGAQPGDDIIRAGNNSRPNSGWEKMGLIISGGVMGSDYAKQTAQNTKKIADKIDAIVPVPMNNYRPFNMMTNLP